MSELAHMFDGLATVCLIALVVCALSWQNWCAYGRLPTFGEFRRRHPEAFKGGRFRCIHCDGGRVFIHSLDLHRRRHICVSCGKCLYRS